MENRAEGRSESEGMPYFCAPWTGLPDCFLLASAILLPVAAFDCVPLPDAMELVEEVFPLPEAPLAVGAAVAGDAIIATSWRWSTTEERASRE